MAETTPPNDAAETTAGDSPETAETPPPATAVEVPPDDLQRARALVANRATLHAKVAHVSASVARLPKTRRAPAESGGYAFTPVEDMAAAITRLLGALEVVCLPETVEVLTAGRDPGGDGRRHYWTLRVTWLLSDGTTDLRVQSVGEAADWGDKGANKAQTAARKYAYVTAFHLQMGDDDTDRHTGRDPEPGPARQARRQQRAANRPDDAQVGERKAEVLRAFDGDEAAAFRFLRANDCGSWTALKYPKVWETVREALAGNGGARASAAAPAGSGGGSQRQAGRKQAAADVGPEVVEDRYQLVLSSAGGDQDAAHQLLRDNGVRAKSGLGFNQLWRKVAAAAGVESGLDEG